MDLKEYLKNKKAMVEMAMEDLVPTGRDLLPDHAGHFEAMRYSLFAGGKRIRPILCVASYETLGGKASNILPVAVALECIHTYSLIHDDLPAMDNDDLRRGKPTNHKIYGEAGAILAGDGLLTKAFELLSSIDNSVISSDLKLRIINIIASAVGSLGMVGGQVIDIAYEGKEIDFPTLKQIHSRKTGALITASVQVGAVAADANENQLASLARYGEKIGLAFQIIDDLLNVEGTSEQLGKAAGSDAERGKATYPAFFGTAETRRLAGQTIDEAITYLENFDNRAEPLRELALYIKSRNN